MCAPGCFSILLFEFCSWLYNIWLSLPHMYLRLICRLLFCSPFSFTPFLFKKNMPYFFCFLAPDRWPRPTGHEQQTAVTSHVSPWLIFLWASGLFNLKIFRGHHLNGRVWVLSYDSSDYLVATTNQPSFIDPGLTASKMHPLSLSVGMGQLYQFSMTVFVTTRAEYKGRVPGCAMAREHVISCYRQ